MRLLNILVLSWLLQASVLSADRPEGEEGTAEAGRPLRIAVVHAATPAGAMVREGVLAATYENPEVLVTTIAYTSEEDGIQRLREIARADAAIDVVIGPTESSTFLAAGKRRKDLSGVLIISPLATAYVPQKEDPRWLFSTNVNLERRTAAILDFLSSRGVSSIALLFPNTELGSMMEDAFRTKLTARQREEYFPLSFEDLATARQPLRRIIELRPEAIGLLGGLEDLTSLYATFAQVNTEGSYSPILFTTVGARSATGLPEDFHFVSVLPPGETDTPGEAWALAYDTASLLARLGSKLLKGQTLKERRELLRDEFNTVMRAYKDPTSKTRFMTSEYENVTPLLVCRTTALGIEKVDSVKPSGLTAILNQKAELLRRRYGWTPFLNLLLLCGIACVFSIFDITRNMKHYHTEEEPTKQPPLLPLGHLLRWSALILVLFNLLLVLLAYISLAEAGSIRYNSVVGALVVGTSMMLILRLNLQLSSPGTASREYGFGLLYERFSRWILDARIAGKTSSRVTIVGLGLFMFALAAVAQGYFAKLILSAVGSFGISSVLSSVYFEYRSSRQKLQSELAAAKKVILDLDEDADLDNRIHARKEKVRLTFEDNLKSLFRLLRMETHDLSFYADSQWDLQPQINILLGKNGYGKSLLLRMIAGILQYDSKTHDLFGGRSGGSSIDVSLLRDRETVLLRCKYRALNSSIGKIPVLAIPDTRTLNRSITSVGPPAKDLRFKENAAYHFLHDEPYEPMIQSYLHGLCLQDLRDQSGSSRRRFESPPFRLARRIVNELTESDFKFHKIEQLPGESRFVIEVLTEGNIDHPLPIQNASQGTLSILAMFGLIYNYLSAVWPKAGVEEVCEQPAIVFIDEIDAHLHPSWQQKMIRLLRETFPNVQFIVTAHSPMVAAGCFEGEAAVLRKGPRGFFVDQIHENLLGAKAIELYPRLFEVEDVDENFAYYATRLSMKDDPSPRIRKLEAKKNRTAEEEAELAELHRKARHLGRVQEVRRRREDEDLEERIEILEAENRDLRRRMAAEGGSDS